ncbi:MAG: glycine oxidase ThiO [Gemmatimonadota bacterium]|nr:MAG: glycine oxidase ThiO [Gemmatimonadota bacterium]
MSKQVSHPDILIVGGGVIGAACARALARRDVSVSVVEAGDRPGSATPAAAGMLAPFAEAQAEDPLLALCVGARDLYGDLAPELQEETGIDIQLRSDGIVQLAFTEEEASRLKSAIAWQRQIGFATEWLSPDEVRERVPGVGPDILGAALAPEDGGLVPNALREACLRSAELRGAQVVKGALVEEIVVEGGRVRGVRTADGLHQAGAVVLAAGCWSGGIAGLPRALPVEPFRGQMVALAWPRGEPPAIVYGGGGYVLERDGEAIAGSTMEQAGFATGTTEEGLRLVHRYMRRIFPSLAGKPVRRTWAGLRPVTPDRHPIVGPDPDVPNLWYATGHGRNGILLAGITGEILAQLYVGEQIEHDLTPMAVDRFN